VCLRLPTYAYDGLSAPYSRHFKPMTVARAGGATRFTGYFRDAETGLDYAKNRYHQPGMGRFLTPDPYQQSAGQQDPGSWNRYAYVAGDPVNRTDRRGLSTDCTGDDCDESDDDDGTCDADFCANGYAVSDGDGGAGNDEGNDDSDDDDSDSQNNDTPPCQAVILSAVNNQFGTNFTNSSVQSTFTNGGAFNLVINGTGLTPSQFNSIQPGRFPNGLIGIITGSGKSLHITGQTTLDPTAIFTKSNNGGVTSVIFTAHIDSAFAYNPIGALLHYLKDVQGQATRNPCP